MGHTALRHSPSITQITNKGWGIAAGTLTFCPIACPIPVFLGSFSERVCKNRKHSSGRTIPFSIHPLKLPLYRFILSNAPNSVRQLLALFICSLVSYAMHGQTFTDDLRDKEYNGGSLEVVQSTTLDSIVNEKELGKATAVTVNNKQQTYRQRRPKYKSGQTPTERVSGFRIQIYQGTGSEGQANAKKMQARARQAFPGFSTYVSLNGPRWVCRIGDFQTNEEAQAFLRRVRSSGISKTVSIVRSPIFVIY